MSMPCLCPKFKTNDVSPYSCYVVSMFIVLLRLGVTRVLLKCSRIKFMFNIDLKVNVSNVTLHWPGLFLGPRSPLPVKFSSREMIRKLQAMKLNYNLLNHIKDLINTLHH